MSEKKKITNKKKNSLWFWLGGTAVLLIIVGVVLIKQISSPELPSLPAEINGSQTSKMQDAGALILDVREPSEWAQGHIEGAVLIPLGELASRVNELPQNRDIIVVCRSGNRSAKGRDLLLSAGFQRVTSMTGGMNQWVAEGYPVITGQ